MSLAKNHIDFILNKIINAPCGTLKLLLALGVAKYIKSYKNHFVVQYATDYCPLEHDNYKTISAHLGSPISCYINNLHGAFIFLLSVDRCSLVQSEAYFKTKYGKIIINVITSVRLGPLSGNIPTKRTLSKISISDDPPLTNLIGLDLIYIYIYFPWIFIVPIIGPKVTKTS